MFLKKSRKTYKGKIYETYALTESYRENGKVKHRNICNLGSLTEEQAQRIRLVLKTQNIENAFVGHLSDVVAKRHYRFLDVAVLDHIWCQFDLDRFFTDLPYAETMAVNRCLEPKSKIQIRNWTEQTVLPRLLKIGFDDDSEYSIYRALDKIADQEVELQSHIYQKLQQLGQTIESAVFYDITSSYFEGSKCILAAYGYSRDKRRDRLQITIALVITPQGYPFYWRVMPGNTQDITTVENLLTDLKKRFGIRKCLLVFDRGMVSEDNLQAIAEQKLSYVSALDKDEIPGLKLLQAEFQNLVYNDNWRPKLLANGFRPYDQEQKLFYQEHSKGSRRYILTFDRQLYEDHQQNRQERFKQATNYFKELNAELKQAKRSRNLRKTEAKIERRLRKLKMHKVFDYILEPLMLTTTTSKGKERTVNSFNAKYTIREDALKHLALLDGITCFVTNQPEYKLRAREVIHYYRRKNKVEEAFREIKGYLHLRPFYLSREKRVRAHVSICVLGYLLLNTLEDKLRQAKEASSSIDALEILGKCLLNRIGLKNSKTYTESITEATKDQLKLLEKLGLKHLISKKYLKNILEHSTM